MGFSGAVRITDLNDYIAPAQSCVVSLNGSKLDVGQQQREDEVGGPVCALHATLRGMDGRNDVRAGAGACMGYLHPAPRPAHALNRSSSSARPRCSCTRAARRTTLARSRAAPHPRCRSPLGLPQPRQGRQR